MELPPSSSVSPPVSPSSVSSPSALPKQGSIKNYKYSEPRNRSEYRQRRQIGIPWRRAPVVDSSSLMGPSCGPTMGTSPRPETNAIASLARSGDTSGTQLTISWKPLSTSPSPSLSLSLSLSPSPVRPWWSWWSWVGVSVRGVRVWGVCVGVVVVVVVMVSSSGGW
ncbi:hypothetical protein CRUP_037328 [Coryphaenoides rupestris]|nr:hypothetical protein CRUP_037328 [Coryphaenoides rupestris]